MKKKFGVKGHTIPWRKRTKGVALNWTKGMRNSKECWASIQQLHWDLWLRKDPKNRSFSFAFFPNSSFSFFFLSLFLFSGSKNLIVVPRGKWRKPNWIQISFSVRLCRGRCLTHPRSEMTSPRKAVKWLNYYSKCTHYKQISSIL